MELESSYNLLGVMRDDGIRTYRAMEIASGQEMQVHVFAKSDSEGDRALFKALRALPVSKRRELLEIGIDGDLPYIVTDKLPEGSTAREWMTKLAGVAAKPSGSVFLEGSWKTGTPLPEELLRASHTSGPPVPPAPKKPAELSADYTRVMRVPQVLSGPPEIPLSRPEEVSQKPEPVLPPEPPVAALQPPVEEPDEFTRMFGNASPPAVEPVVLEHEPGEFTRMFLSRAPAEPAAVPPPGPPPVSAPVPPPVSAPVPPVAPSNPPGEFTSQFLAPKLPDRSPVAAPEVGNQKPGEFTSMFLAAQPPRPTPQPPAVEPAAPPPSLQANASPAVQPPPVQPSSEEATRLFQAVTPSTPPSGLAPPPKAGKEPGEFTRMFPSFEQPVSPTGPGSLPGPPLGSLPGPPLGSSPDPPRKEGPSEFTRFFQSPMYPAPAGNQKMPPSTPALQPTTRPSAQPSEFEQMFGSPGKPGATPPPPLGSGSSSSATGLFSVPKAAPPRAPVKAAGPGEFTRMMSASAAPMLGQPVAKPAAPEPEQVKSNVLLYVIGGAVLLAIILIVVFFMLRH